ncbi:MAG: DUF3108 domain-containing protein [Gammaproteobacteria bacterium]|nr:DUF3108 domain-containing protein [Gammaproteobacteria bacterium]
MTIKRSTNHFCSAKKSFDFKKQFSFLLFLLIATFPFGLQAETFQVENEWSFLKPYTAKFTIYQDDDKVGNLTQSLTLDSITENKDQQTSKTNQIQWQFNTSTKIKKWFVSLNYQEHSLFTIEKNNLLPLFFNSNKSVTFKDDQVISQQFDWKNKKETGYKNKRKWSVDLAMNTYDTLGHLIKLRQDLNAGLTTPLTYTISQNGKQKQYDYQLVGEEIIETETTKFTTIKLKRADKKEKDFYIWLDKNNLFMPVQMQQVEEDDSVTIKLEKLILPQP